MIVLQLLQQQLLNKRQPWEGYTHKVLYRKCGRFVLTTLLWTRFGSPMLKFDWNFWKQHVNHIFAFLPDLLKQQSLCKLSTSQSCRVRRVLLNFGTLEFRSTQQQKQHHQFIKQTNWQIEKHKWIFLVASNGTESVVPDNK